MTRRWIRVLGALLPISGLLLPLRLALRLPRRFLLGLLRLTLLFLLLLTLALLLLTFLLLLLLLSGLFALLLLLLVLLLLRLLLLLMFGGGAIAPGGSPLGRRLPLFALLRLAVPFRLGRLISFRLARRFLGLGRPFSIGLSGGLLALVCCPFRGGFGCGIGSLLLAGLAFSGIARGGVRLPLIRRLNRLIVFGGTLVLRRVLTLSGLLAGSGTLLPLLLLAILFLLSLLLLPRLFGGSGFALLLRGSLRLPH